MSPLLEPDRFYLGMSSVAGVKRPATITIDSVSRPKPKSAPPASFNLTSGCLARKQRGKWWELRATVGLARLLTKQGRRDEAHAMLVETYGWFTEGFHNADLMDARALLDQLSGGSPS